MNIDTLTSDDIDLLEGTIYEKVRERAWKEGNLRYKLDSLQRSIASTLDSLSTKESLILSSRQIGKSYAMCVYAIEYCIKHPGSIVRVAAPTLKQAQDIVSDNIEPIISDAPKDLIQKLKSTYRWQIGTSQLRLGILERANVDSLRGGNAKLIICEEGGFVSSDDYRYALKSVIAPQLLRSSGQLIHVSSPSKEPEHYLHTEVLPKCELTNSVFRYTVYDSPSLSEKQIEEAKKLIGGEESDDWKREYLAQIIRDQSVVCVPEFDESRHTILYDRPEHSFYLTSIDTGGVRDKTVALLMTYDFKRSVVVVVDERVFDANTVTDEVIDEIKNMEFEANMKQRFADAPGQLLVDLKHKHDYSANLPRKDDWEAGLNAVRLMFSQGKLLVSRECHFLIQTLKAATFNKQRTDFARTESLGHMDALAALMYGVRMIDKQSNPYPREKLDWENKIYPIHMANYQSKEKRVAAALVPKSFMRK